MTSANNLLKNLIGVKNIVITDCRTYDDSNGVRHPAIAARPDHWNANKCPCCGRKKLPRYDQPAKNLRSWRCLDFGGVLVEIVSHTHRVVCPEHGIVTADVPWAYPNSGFTKAFDMTAAWLAKYLPRSAVANYMRIDWKTVGNCISRSLRDLEPDLSKRLDGLVRIGINETSYCKGHKYITVIVNHDTNTVVWAAERHGKDVLTQFYEQLTDEQKATIKVVTGDGARWITDCVNEFTPDCIRCVDPFHVVEWAMEALDKLRAERWHKAVDKVKALSNGKAEADLNHWLWWASHSRIPVFHDLYEKIKLIIRKAYGFRNIQNMLDMVYLVCSNITIPLPNRKLRNR